MVTTVLLYGSLGKRFGRNWRLDVNTPAQAVNAINHLRPGFADAILSMRDVDFGVKVGKKQIGAGLLQFPTGGKQITITPVVRGSGNSKGWIEVIAGVVLIAAGILLSGTPLGVASPFLIGMGISLVLGGVATLLSPTPNTTTPASAQRPSYQFSNVVNTIGEGECVPCLYGGPLWIGSYVVSAGYENVDITTGSTSPNPFPNTTSNVGPIEGQPITSQRFVP
jgi:predicted phage tail protein